MKKTITLFLTLLIVSSSQFVKAQLEYKDVAPIFYARCTSCHHENQHAPSYMNYSETFAHVYAMSGQLSSNLMPPWSPDTAYTRFVHERLISSTEKNAILNWISHGALAGDTTLAPPAPTYAQYQLNGTPDKILKIPTFTSNASTQDSYCCFSIPTNLAQDRILRAYEIVAGNPSIVHHVVVNIDTTGTVASDLSGGCFTISGQVGIGGFAPGAPPTVFPSQAPLKAGIRVKAGSNMVLQIHYPAGTSGQLDSTQIRLYYYPIGATGIRTIYNSVPLQNWGLNIPANTTATFTANYVLPGAISLFATFPHSHKICTRLINYAYLGTDTIPIIKINNWRFDWQGYYTFPSLVKVPTSYSLFSSHFYDNTVANINNPFSPPHHILAGTNTTDEMLFDSFLYLPYQPGDELIDVASILANDPLLATNVDELLPAPFTMFAYPNPASDNVNVYLSKKGDYKLTLFTIAGQQVLQTQTSNEETILDTKNVADGLYILNITNTKSNDKITKKIVISH